MNASVKTTVQAIQASEDTKISFVERLDVVRLDQIEIEPQQWIWDGRIPVGCITVIEGYRSSGKTQIALDIAARVSSGRAMPDGSPGLQGDILIIDGIDNLHTQIKARLRTAEADMSRIHYFDTHSPLNNYEKSHLPFFYSLAGLIEETQPKLIIFNSIDHTFSHLPENVIMQTLIKLQYLLATENIACIMLRNSDTKGQNRISSRADKSPSIDRAANSILHIQPLNVTGEQDTFLLHNKLNSLSLPAHTVQYTIVSDPIEPDYPMLTWNCDYVTANTPEYAFINSIREKILHLLAYAYPKPLKHAEIVHSFPNTIPPNTITRSLRRLFENQSLIQPSRGLYALSPKIIPPNFQSPREYQNTENVSQLSHSAQTTEPPTPPIPDVTFTETEVSKAASEGNQIAMTMQTQPTILIHQIAKPKTKLSNNKSSRHKRRR